MRVRAWFGTVEDGKCVSRAPVFESDESVKQFNDSFRTLASICGVRDYIGELRDLMLSVTREALKESSFDLRIIELVNFLDEINESLSALQDMKENSLHPPPPSFEEALSALKRAKQDVEMEILKEMRNNAPNLSEVAGELLGARLISLAGSLRRLASLPSTSVQVLGAEKALFKHLQRGTPPPKHGAIYVHPLLKGVKKRKRGKVAKIIASYISLASRADAFSGRRLNLRERMEREVEEVLR
ncbi:MAG: nucleolar protein 56 [Archaeoglobi archaeon]|nr:nucleolar protein 56 [Archaeoglobi archaeon]